MRIKAKLIFDDSAAAWRISCAYNHAWVTELKIKVAHKARRWDAATKTWLIDAMFLDVVKQLCDKHLDGWEEHKPTAPPPQAAMNSGAFHDFLVLCPTDEVKKLYRAAALALHPDKGGDADKMSKLNVAWNAIKTELKL
jgi:hypothetical protein